MKRALGGERLGSGNRMNVEMRNYERSTHDLSYLWRSTMSAGTLVPFMSIPVLPGDTFDIHLNCDIKTHPTVGPLFGSHKVQLDVFVAPIRLYQGQLHNNKLGIGLNMANVKLPQIELYATSFIPQDAPDLDNSQINPSALLSYLGIRGVGLADPGEPDVTRKFNALSILAYWDTYKNYYANKQEEIGACIHNPGVTPGATPTSVDVKNTIVSAFVNVPLQGAGAANTPISPGGTIKITVAAGPTQPNPDQIMVNLTDGRRYSVAEIMGTATPTYNAGTGVWQITYGGAGFGTIYIDSYQLRQPWEMIIRQPIVQIFELDDIDCMRERILQASMSNSAFLLNTALNRAGTDPLTPYRYIWDKNGNFPFMLSSQQALGLKTYQSDLFNNWLQTEWIDGPGGIADITAIDTSGGSFNIDTLVLSKKVYDMLNRIAVSGGSYDDWLDAVYTEERFQRASTPMYMGGLIKELVFQEVVSNSAGSEDGATQPLGTLAGKGVMSGKHKGGTVVAKIDEPSYLIGIISITPRIDYSQGNKWDVHLETMDDFHKPALDEIGFQELITEQMAWWSTNREYVNNTWQTKSAGKQPAWINYMTSVNETRGNFAIANNEMFMTLNRRYEPAFAGAGPNYAEIADLTTYIDPVKFNQIFAQTALDAQNYWSQISVDIVARRKMSAKVMPNL